MKKSWKKSVFYEENTLSWRRKKIMKENVIMKKNVIKKSCHDKDVGHKKICGERKPKIMTKLNNLKLWQNLNNLNCDKTQKL